MVQTMFDTTPTQNTVQISDEERLIQTLNHARADKKADYTKKVQEYKLPQIIIDTILNNPTAESWEFNTLDLPHIKNQKATQRGRSLFAKETIEFDVYLEEILTDKLLSLNFYIFHSGPANNKTNISYVGE